MRRSEKSGIKKNATINNEQTTINACFKYCYDKGLVHIQKLIGVMRDYVLERNISHEVKLLRQIVRLLQNVIQIPGQDHEHLLTS